MAKDLFTPAWFPFYYGKFNSATQLFTAEAIGTYIIMLNYQWDNGGLPNDVDELCVLTKSSLKSVEKVLAKFDLMEDGLLWNVRLEEIREEQYAKYLKSKEKADRANATIRMKKQNQSMPSTERTTLHTTERSASEQRNVNDTQIDVDVDNRLSYDNKEIDTKVSKKKAISLYEFRLIVDQALASCIFSDKFTEKSKSYFYSWAKTENKITALKKIKTDLAKYFQKEIDYLSKYAPNQIEYMLEQASRKCYIGYVEKDLPEPQRIIKPQLKELYSDPEPIKPKEPIQFNIPDEFK